MPFSKERHRRSVTLETERRAVEREVFVCHRANRGLVGKEPHKAGSVTVQTLCDQTVLAANAITTFDISIVA